MISDGTRRALCVAALLALATVCLQGARLEDGRAARAASEHAPADRVSVAVATPAQQAAARARMDGDDAVFDGDVTVPDGTVFAPGQHFVKTWRIRNSGTTTWQSGYSWHFEAGNPLSSVLSVPAPITPPGQDALLSVPMIAPSQAGTYTSFWQMTDPSGAMFGHQAYVTIDVRTAGEQTLTTTPTASATPLGASTGRATPLPTATSIPVQPTVALPGGGGQMVGSPWIGALAYRTFLAAGSTAHGVQEQINMVYPGPGVAHVRLTLYRPDAAQRQVLFTLGSHLEQSFDLARVAPGTDLAAVVEADRAVVVDRTLSTGSSLLAAPGAPRTARQWFFPAIEPQAQADQRLIVFNPHDVPVRVSVVAGHSATTCCERALQLTVPPREQFVDDLGTNTALRGPLLISATDAVALERLTLDGTSHAMDATAGVVSMARVWYFPGGRSGPNGTVIRLFNPGARDEQATLRLALAAGGGPSRSVTVPRSSQIDVSVGALTAATTFGIEVDADGPLVAEATTLSTHGQPESYAGSSDSSRTWVLLGADGGKGTSQTLQVLNPSGTRSSLTCTVTANGNRTHSWTATLPPHSSYSRVVDGLLPTHGAWLQVSATAPVVVGRLLTSAAGAATSIARGVQD